MLLCLSLFISCNKTYDEPPVTEIPIGDIISISGLKDSLSAIKNNDSTSFSITGNITTEETNGNFYKVAYMQDTSGAVELNLNYSGGLYIGDSIIINLDSLDIDYEDNKLTINNIDVDKSIMKIATKKFVEPKLITYDSIDLSKDQCRLVTINNVQFQTAGITYADPAYWIGGANANLIIEDCDLNSFFVRTSDYANFGDVLVDSGNGSITGILNSYNEDIQLFIRDINEVNMNGDRCSGGSIILNKDFSDGSITSGGWLNFWSGTNPNIGEWEIFTTFGSNGDVAKASNYSNFSNYACESWLVSPSFDLTGTSSPYLIFDNCTRYNGPGLELYISSNYDGTSDPSQQGTWTPLNQYVPNWDTDDGTWNLVSSGNVDLTPFISSNLNIAFKYIGTNADGATWELDNIIVTD